MKLEKKPIFINYPEIHPSPIKRLLILKSLIRIINTRDNLVSYLDLGLKTEDAELFKNYLSENYSEYFDPKKKTINLFENYNGKIICGIDTLLDDLFSILNKKMLDDTKESTKTDGPENPAIPTVSIIDKIIDEIDTYKNTDDELESAFKWIFLDHSDPAVIREEMQVHLTNIYTLDEDKIKKFFNSERIFFEFLKIYTGRTKREIKDKFVQTRGKLLLCLEDFERNFSDKRYWSNLKIESHNIFKNIHDAILLPKSDELKIFLIIRGDPNKNKDQPVISYYNNKVVLFNKESSQYRKLQPQELVLADLLLENPTSYIFNPKRILTKIDAFHMIEFGIEACPSKEQVLNFLKED